VKVFKTKHFDLCYFVLEKALHAWKKIKLSILWAQDLCKLVNGCWKCFLYPQVIDFRQLMIEWLKFSPVFWSKDKYKSWEIVWSMIAHVFIAATFSGRYVEINNLRIDVLSSFESSDEWTDILEGRSSDELRCWILQKSVVYLGKLFSLLFNTGYLSNLSNLVGTGLTNLLFWI